MHSYKIDDAGLGDRTPPTPLKPAPELQTTRQQVLREAERLIHSDRNKEYGSPADNFGQSALLIDAYLKRKPVGVDFTAADVAAVMILMKISRLSNNPTNLDSWIDIAGYAACGAEVRELD